MKPADAIEVRDRRQYASFSVGDLLLGIDVLKVQEVLRSQEMTRVPLAPEMIEGLINLRGQIVTAVDLGRRLKLDGSRGVKPINIVVQSAEGPMGLLVDEIGDVVEVNASTYEAVPEHVPAEQRELLEGIYKLPNGLLLVLNIDKVFE